MSRMHKYYIMLEEIVDTHVKRLQEDYATLKTDCFRAKGLSDQFRNIAGGRAVFSTQINSLMQTMLRAGFRFGLTEIRATSTNLTDEGVQMAVFP